MADDAKMDIVHDHEVNDYRKLGDDIEAKWMDIVSNIDDLKPAMNDFIKAKKTFDVTEVTTRSFFTALKLYIGDLHSYLLWRKPIEPEGWKVAANKMYSLLRFVKPAFDDINFLRHLFCMKTMGWMNVVLVDDSLPFKIRDLVCDYSIQHLKSTEYSDHEKEGIAILQHLLGCILKEKETSEEIQKSLHSLLDLTEYIRFPDWFANDTDDLRKQIINSLFSKIVYSSNDGIIWASYVLVANKKFYWRTKLEDFWKQMLIIDEAGFVAFGEIFFNAWLFADSETKLEIEEIYIQRLMKEALVFSVVVDEKEKQLKKLLFTTLNKLHSYKNKLVFSYTLTKLYKPILWRYLRSSEDIERRYAAEVFFDIFPLEEHRITDNESLMDRQVKEIKDLLLDDCREIRIIAIKHICRILICPPTIFTVLHVKTILTVIADDLATDESSCLVRKTVFEEFGKMLDYPDSRKLMFQILPAMGSLINDKDESVRRAFMDILIKIHRTPEFKISFCKIVSTYDLLRRIDTEGPIIGKQISTLIYPKLFSKNQPVCLSIKKLKIMCSINPKAAMYVVKYAKGEMDFPQGHKIVSSILDYMKESLAEHRKISGAVKKNTHKNPNGSNGEDTISCYEFLNNHKLVISTLETITCIWELFHDEFLNGKSNSCKNVYATSKIVIPLLSKFYKEPPLLKAIKELLNVTKTKKSILN